MTTLFRSIIQSRFITYNLVFIFSAIFLNPCYGTIDEFFISDLIISNYTGRNEFLLVFVQPLLGAMLKFLSIVLSLQNVYSLFLVEIIILSLIIFEKNLKFKKSSPIKIVFLIQSIFILVIFIQLPTFTSAAVLIAAINAISVSQTNLSEEKFRVIVTWVLIGFAIMLRQEVIFILILVIISTIIINKITENRLNSYSYILGIFVVFLFTLLNRAVLILNTTSDWNAYYLWNSFRHQLHNRISQFRLDEILVPGGWKPEEHNLFVDWSYGDPTIFNIEWIKIGYDYTNNLRGIRSLFNLDLTYFFFNLNRYEIQSNWSLLFVIQVIITFYLGLKLGLFRNLVICLLAWIPSALIFIYSAFFLLLPQRVVFPLLMIPVLIMLAVAKKLISKDTFPKIIWSPIILITIYYISITLNTSQSNKLEKQDNELLLGGLKSFNANATYLIPMCNNPYSSENPYKFIGKNRPIKILNVGCWDTFSPLWNQRKANFGLTSVSIYDDLFQKDVYWLGNYIPDTSINIENLLRNKGQTDFKREAVKELSGDYVLFKFSKANS